MAIDLLVHRWLLLLPGLGLRPVDGAADAAASSITNWTDAAACTGSSSRSSSDLWSLKSLLTAAMRAI